MILGQAIAGVGFGASFTAALRLIVPLVAIDERAGVVSAIYVVSYVAFGVPIVAEGLLADAIGDVPAVVWYTVLTLLFALISLIAQIRQHPHRPGHPTLDWHLRMHRAGTGSLSFVLTLEIDRA